MSFLISPSQFLIDKFKEYGFKKKIIKLPNPVVNFEKTIKTAGKKNYILYFGRLSEEKGLDVLIRAYSCLDDDIDLYLAGDGPEALKLKKLSENIVKSNNIKFLGQVNSSKIKELICGAEFIALASKCYENSPYGAIEAMYLGKAVVAPKIGGIPELIKDKETGFLYNPQDEKELVRIFRYLIKNTKIKKSIGIKARIIANKTHDKNIFYNNLMKIYKSLL